MMMSRTLGSVLFPLQALPSDRKNNPCMLSFFRLYHKLNKKFCEHICVSQDKDDQSKVFNLLSLRAFEKISYL